MPDLPSVVQTGRIHWKVEADYLPAGASAPITAPAQGVITVEPMRKSVNVDDTSTPGSSLTLGFQTRVLALDPNGVVERDLPADFLSEGWDYRVTPSLTIKGDDGKYVTAGAELNRAFAFHLAPGATVDLATARAAGKAPSTGTTTGGSTGSTGGTGTTTPGAVDSSTTFPVIS